MVAWAAVGLALAGLVWLVRPTPPVSDASRGGELSLPVAADEGEGLGSPGLFATDTGGLPAQSDPAGRSDEAGSQEPLADRIAASPKPAAGEGAEPRDAGRQEAEAARERAAASRAAAGKAGVDSLFPGRFADVDAQYARAVAALREGRFRLAVIDLEAAAGRFEDLVEQAQLQAATAVAAETRPPAADERTREQQVGGELSVPEAAAPWPATGDSTPEAQPAASVSPDVAIGALLETYRQAIEAEDLERLAVDVYRGPIPGENEEFLRLLFSRAEGIAITTVLEDLEVAGDSAHARVDQKMDFRLSTTRQRRSLDLSLEMFFARSGADWRLERFRR